MVGIWLMRPDTASAAPDARAAAPETAEGPAPCLRCATRLEKSSRLGPMFSLCCSFFILME